MVSGCCSRRVISLKPRPRTRSAHDRHRIRREMPPRSGYPRRHHRGGWRWRSASRAGRTTAERSNRGSEDRFIALPGGSDPISPSACDCASPQEVARHGASLARPPAVKSPRGSEPTIAALVAYSDPQVVSPSSRPFDLGRHRGGPSCVRHLDFTSRLRSHHAGPRSRRRCSSP